MSISELKTSFIVSLVFFMGIATALLAQATKPAPPTPIDEKKVTRWDGLESAMGPDHREGAAARDAFFAGPPGRPSILPAILRDERNRQTHILGLLLPGTCGR